MKTQRRTWWVAPLALVLTASLGSPVFAQTTGATVTGTVSEKTGGVLKDADVKAVNQKTNVEYPTKTNDAGIYTILSLPIGSYVVKAEAKGFKQVATNAVTLETGQTARVNLKLEL